MSAASSEERWRAVSEVLDALFELRPEKRPERLESLCRDDPELRREVESYLASDAASGILDAPLDAVAADLLGSLESVEGEDDDGDAIGARIGPFRILQELGRGGMGIVYLAERAGGGFAQRVALKLVKRGLDTEEILARFLRERQILARLVHPAIARLVDGGSAPDGRPYFAMEYVEGVPITSYCEAHKLHLAKRLELFCTVCDAVELAHRSLVVHRDLKPSNILVSETGQPKLLDFGIAKLLSDDGAAEATALTRSGVRALTPEYAAPELLRGEPATTATDVFALGLILYVLVTGRHPFRDVHSTSPEVEHAILTLAPKPPSATARQTTAESAGSGSSIRFGLAPRRLSRRLQGDLDRITLTALRKEPDRRYRSVAALAEDIRRRLRHEPIAARPDTLRYRTAKFLRRNRVGATAAALLVLAVAGGTLGTLWQARARSREARKALEVQRFLVDLFEANDPAEARGRNITARELLDRGARRIDAELAAQPEVQAELFGLVGTLYRQIGALDRAAPPLERSLAMERRLHGDEHADVARALGRWALLLWDRGDYEAAEARQREALAMRRRLLASDDPLVAESLTELASVLSDRGRFEEAATLHREALALDRQRFGDDSAAVATDLNDLAVVLWNRGQNDEAAGLERKALELRLRQLGEDHPDTAASLHSLASILSDRGDYEEAENLFQRALELRRKLLGPRHPAVAVTLANYAILRQHTGDLQSAKSMLEEALAIRQEVLEPDHPELATTLNNLGVLSYRLGDYSDAESYTREALTLWERTLGHRHPSVASCLNNLGMMRLAQGDARGAEPLVREGLTLRRELLGADHPAIPQSLRNLGLILLEERHLPEAGATLTEALELARVAYTSDHPRVAEILVALGRVRSDQGRDAEADRFLRAALRIRRQRFGEADSRTAEVEVFLGECLAREGRESEASDLLARSYRNLLAQRGAADPLVERARTALAAVTGRPVMGTRPP